MNDTYLYGSVPASVEGAAGVKGVIIRTLDGLLFRAYRFSCTPPGRFQ